MKLCFVLGKDITAFASVALDGKCSRKPPCRVECRQSLARWCDAIASAYLKYLMYARISAILYEVDEEKVGGRSMLYAGIFLVGLLIFMYVTYEFTLWALAGTFAVGWDFTPEQNALERQEQF
jgi:hypothetical protein